MLRRYRNRRFYYYYFYYYYFIVKVLIKSSTNVPHCDCFASFCVLITLHYLILVNNYDELLYVLKYYCDRVRPIKRKYEIYYENGAA